MDEPTWITDTPVTRTLEGLLLGLTSSSILIICEGINLPLMRRFHLGYGSRCLLELHSRIRKRVFILGPSHHVYLNCCALSKCTHYETPMGDLPIDTSSSVSTICSNSLFFYLALRTKIDNNVFNFSQQGVEGQRTIWRNGLANGRGRTQHRTSSPLHSARVQKVKCNCNP